ARLHVDEVGADHHDLGHLVLVHERLDRAQVGQGGDRLHHLCESCARMSSTAGPSSTIHRLGKMKMIIGKSIFSVALAPISWARWRRRRRSSSDWRRRMRAMPVPRASDWTTAWAKPW